MAWKRKKIHVFKYQEEHKTCGSRYIIERPKYQCGCCSLPQATNTTVRCICGAELVSVLRKYCTSCNLFLIPADICIVKEYTGLRQ